MFLLFSISKERLWGKHSSISELKQGDIIGMFCFFFLLSHETDFMQDLHLAFDHDVMQKV